MKGYKNGKFQNELQNECHNWDCDCDCHSVNPSFLEESRLGRMKVFETIGKVTWRVAFAIQVHTAAARRAPDCRQTVAGRQPDARQTAARRPPNKRPPNGRQTTARRPPFFVPGRPPTSPIYVKWFQDFRLTRKLQWSFSLKMVVWHCVLNGNPKTSKRS